TEAVATVRLHVSTDRTTFVVLTSNTGRLLNCPMGTASKPDVEFANKFAPSDETMILDVMASGSRSPSSGVRLDDRMIWRAPCVEPVWPIMPPGMTAPPVFCGLFVFNGLIAGCVENVA